MAVLIPKTAFLMSFNEKFKRQIPHIENFRYFGKTIFYKSLKIKKNSLTLIDEWIT
jgi:hypothetical protein